MSDASHDETSSKRYTLPHSRKLHGSLAFDAVYAARMRKNAGPLSVASRPNELGYCRIGLSVSRRVGNAVKRNAIKRRLREAFRQCQHDWPTGYDVVVVVRPHEVLSTADYQKALFGAIRSSHLEWQRRERRRSRDHASEPAEESANGKASEG